MMTFQLFIQSHDGAVRCSQLCLEVSRNQGLRKASGKPLDWEELWVVVSRPVVPGKEPGLQKAWCMCVRAWSNFCLPPLFRILSVRCPTAQEVKSKCQTGE